MSELNDPRVLLAAERTLMAWSRTSISLMGFGFVIERFGLFLKLVGQNELTFLGKQISFYVGVSFIFLASWISIYSIIQHKKIIKSLKESEIPYGYSLFTGMIVNSIIGLLGLCLGFYLSFI
ncbi:MAG: DUF202 domain-containing protein [Desulfobacteraceae bacterium]|nr:DUF202 domain-containing protein [Desulfobacteraceae bacterium]